MLFSLLLALFTFSRCSNENKSITHQFILAPDMVINSSGCGFGTQVVDEQDGKSPRTFWEPYKEAYCKGTKAMLAIDLGKQINIVKLHVYSQQGAKMTIISYAKGVSKGKTSIDLVSGWNPIAFTNSVDLLELEFGEIQAIGELLVEADQDYPVSRTVESVRPKPLMQDFIGTNAFVDVPLGVLEPFGSIREYHDWVWNQPKGDTTCLNTTCNGFDAASFYTNLHRLGKQTIPVIQKTPNWISWVEQKRPVKDGLNADIPASYAEHSLFMTKYVQNFKKEENGGISFFENWNEPDRWWDGPECYFTPGQYAALSSADADGDLHKMDPKFGFKEGANGPKMVMAGLAHLKLDYLHAMKYWCDRNRKGDFPWDVINYHQYSNTSILPGDQKMEEMTGVCPEQSRIYERTKEVIDFRNKYLPAIPVWNTEFGFDTEKSPQQSKAIKEKSSELVQADWLIRSYLLLSATGVEKAFQYMIRDFGKEGYYATSGVFSSTLKPEPYRKAAWYYINTLRNVLYNSTFEALRVDSATKIWTITYKNTKDASLKTTLIWHGTQEGKMTTGFQFSLSQGKARIVQFDSHNGLGKISAFKRGDKITITETPIIVQEQGQGVFSADAILQTVRNDSITCVDEHGKEDKTLLDERGANLDPAFGIDKQEIATFWKKGYQNNVTESRTFDFGKQKHLHSVYIFHGAGQGAIKIYAKQGNDWVLVGNAKMNYYKRWKCVALHVATRYLKIERADGWDEIGDMVFYETKQ